MMDTNCCDAMLKYILFIFNFFLFLTGLALITMGAYIQVEMSDYLNFLDNSYLNSSIVFIVVGVVLLVVGFFGCCGACTDSSCMMFMFATMLAAVVIAEISVAVALYAFKNEAEDVITSKMIEGMDNYDPDPKSQYAGVTNTWNTIQSDFHCCGVYNYSNWKEANFSKGEDLPDSCCVVESEGCGKGMLAKQANLSDINTGGCFDKLEQVVVDNIEIVGLVGIIIIFLQVIGVLVTCMLANNMRRRDNYV